MAQDLYWPKMDPSLYQVGIIFNLNMFSEHVHFPQCPFDQGHERLDPYGQGLMDPTRFHQQFAEDLRHQVNFVTFKNAILILIAIVILMTLMQGPYGMGGGSWGDPSKASSAFSPINSGVGLPTSTGLYFFTISLTVNLLLILSISTGFNMGGAGRGYPFYDPISFQRQSQVGQSVQNFNTFGAKKIGFNSTGVTATCRFSHFPRTCKAEIEKSQLISRLSACFKTPSLSRLGLSRRLPAPT